MTTPPVAITAPRGKLVALGSVCALFAAMGAVIFALNPTATLNLIVGVGAMAFFGLGGGYSVVSQWRRSTVIRADDDGLRLRDVGPQHAEVRVTWHDVDRIGADAAHLGVRLRRADALAAAPGVTREWLRSERSRTGWDLVWPAGGIGMPVRDAAARLSARRPA